MSCCETCEDTNRMVKELVEFLEPLKAMAVGMTGVRGKAMQMGMSSSQKDAIARIKELQGR